MERIEINKYNGEKYIEEKIKQLWIKVLVEECGFYEGKEGYLNRDINEEKANIWYAKASDELIATMLLEVNGDEGKLLAVCCIPEYRGTGIAQRLLDKVIEFSRKRIKRIMLGTEIRLERAIAFYEKNNFKEIEGLSNENERYYELVLGEEY